MERQQPGRERTQRLKTEAYNGEIAHCQGCYRSVCRHCLRAALYSLWHAMPATERESIILLAPRVDARNSCCNLVQMPQGYANKKAKPAAILLTSRSGGVAV